MKKKKLIRNISIVFLQLLLTAIIIINFSDEPAADTYNKWAISRDEIVKNNIPDGIKYSEFTPVQQPEYENKIMNYIIALDKELKKDMKIIRTKSVPRTDFLLVKNKLYCVMEDYNTISRSQLNVIITRLSEKYGRANPQKDKNIETYTLSDRDTKVLVIAGIKSNKLDCVVYYYPNRLFKMLITDL